MRTDIEKEYLIRAVDAFKRRFVVITPDFKILATNRSTDGKPISEIVGRRCHEVFYDCSVPCENCAATEAFQTGEPTFRLNQDNYFQDLKKMSCCYLYPLYSGETIEAMVSMDFDLPIMERQDENLKRSNVFFKNLILSSVDGVIAADKKGKILIFNAAAAEISGYPVDEALKHLNIRDVYPGDGAKEIMRKLRSKEYGGKGKLKSYQVDVLRKNNEIIPISLNAAIVYEGNQEVASIGFFHDLRETLRMKRELETTQSQLLQAEKMTSLGKLAAGVAHQLNNPLGGIVLYTQLILEEYKLDQALREDLDRILKDAERCRDTVKELLEFTRQTRHLMQPHDINLAISRTLFLVENHSIFQNIEIIKDLTPSLPLLSADIQQLNHIFLNIFSNAAQAMEGKGKLILKTYQLPGKDRIGIEITDTGPGISSEDLPHIFDPFFTTKEEGEGTGLGLSLVYGIVQNHGGTVKATSKLNEGTTFTIELPITIFESKGDESAK
ncbi:nitrogen regulation protein NR(II) [Thermodesulfobacteriota bacterium]